MRGRRQWVVVGKDKVPINPNTGDAADPTNPDTWGTFEEATSKSDKVGFVLSNNDPYTIIDLDNKPDNPATPEELQRHESIMHVMDSYTEVSISGTGYHIIVEGYIPKGVRRDHVEVYSNDRYMICTGNVHKDRPVANRQELLDNMYKSMEVDNRIELEEQDEVISDSVLFNRALYASNGDKFDGLTRGEWQDMGYDSQSEADYALLAILAYYTQSNEQVRRIFRLTPLGKRDKAIKNNKYLDICLSKIRGKQPPRVDLSAIEVPAAPPAPPQDNEKPFAHIQPPPGLVGQVAHYIYASATRPVPEIALAAAIALVAGITGRAFNVSGTGLNQYIMLLARTGSGKEGAATGIERLMKEVRATVPMVEDFIGPGQFASGQALIKTLDERPCFLSIQGEFGLVLQQICDPRAPAPQVMLRRVLLDLYSKSGFSNVLRSTVYSDSDKNTKTIHAPSVTIFGESTPSTFFEGLSATHIEEGLIPRFSIVEYNGVRPPRNPNSNFKPDARLVQSLADLATVCLTMQNNNTVGNVEITPDALKLLDDYDTRVDGLINNADNTLQLQLWNRAHLKALKLSAVLAVGTDWYTPTITESIAQWALDFVNTEVTNILGRFESGHVGQGEERLEASIRECIVNYLRMGVDARDRYGTPKGLQDKAVVPYNYIRRRVRRHKCFANDRRGATKALKETLQDMCEAGILQQVPPTQASSEYGTTQAVYITGYGW